MGCGGSKVEKEPNRGREEKEDILQDLDDVSNHDNAVPEDAPPEDEQNDEAKEGPMTLADWSKRWDKGQTEFHLQEVHPVLLKHLDRLMEDKKALRILIPLCGKSIDMKWLAEEGNEIVGCEAVEKACKEFFQENNLKHTVVEENGMKMYQAEDKIKISIYCCDFLTLNSETVGTVDCIWDRESLTAINLEDRTRYVDVITSFMKSSSKYLLDTFILDNNAQLQGPPFSCSSEEIYKLYGDRYHIEKVDERDARTRWHHDRGIDSVIENVHLLTLR